MPRIPGRTLALPLLLGVAGCAAGPGMHRTAPLDSLALGRDANGEPCTATRDWRDAALTDPFDESWTIGCRSAAAARSSGQLRIVRSPGAVAAIEKGWQCGAASPVTLAGLSGGEARLCRDTGLAANALVLSGDSGAGRVMASALPAAAGPLSVAIARLTGDMAASKVPDRPAPPVLTANLPPPPGDAAGGGAAAGPDLQAVLGRGIGLNHKGLHAEASRLLNDAVSRVGPDTPPSLAAELSLEAGLADSNIGFRASAAGHFERAAALIAASGAQTPFLQRKRDAYSALDLMNRKDYAAALAALDRLAGGDGGDQPLQDMRLLGLLNSPRRDTGTAGAVGGGDGSLLASLALDATVNWARSVAWLGTGDLGRAEAAIGAARSGYDALIARRVNREALLWLGARIDRQDARLALRRNDFPRAIALFDRAVGGLRLGALGSAGTGNEPIVAETMLEGADALARSGAGRERVRAAYEAAVDAVLATSEGAITPGFGIDRYLDLLIEDAAAGDALAGPSGEAAERYFRALQSIGAPAVARQLGQLQAEVASDPALGVKIRDRADLEREITRLRYAIAAADATPGTDVAALEAQRAAAETRLTATEAELAADPRYSRVDDSPATIAAMRAALAPGETYWALDEVAGRMFALLVAGDRVRIWAVEAPVSLLNDFGTRIRGSIDGRLGEGKLVPFDVPASFALFKLLAGPAEADILAARSLVIDPGGPLENLPATLLVVDRASVDARRGAADAAQFDFSRTAFLGRRMPVGTAVSPRSFLVSRALPASRAGNDFLGFAEHRVTGTGGGLVDVGPSCRVPLADIQALSASLKPIQRHEVDLAVAALGGRSAPVLTGSDFTDSAIEARGDLAQYKILHFATHGLTEGSWGCPQSPPALVTSLVPGSDGLLSFDEIARLRLDANLVVLSACDTSAGVKDEALARQSGQEEAGAQLEGLVRAFLTANARAVLATYWPVSAEADADLFVRTFYTSARDAPIGDALRTAQNALIDRPESSHPFYWAPYFIVGDPQKRALASAPASTGTAAGSP